MLFSRDKNVEMQAALPQTSQMKLFVCVISVDWPVAMANGIPLGPQYKPLYNYIYHFCVYSESTGKSVSSFGTLIQ